MLLEKIRNKTKNPFILDESIDSIHSFLRAFHDQAMDIINIKISKLGGLTKSSLLRDICIEVIHRMDGTPEQSPITKPFRAHPARPTS